MYKKKFRAHVCLGGGGEICSPERLTKTEDLGKGATLN